jgi:outer membrane protein OmpA-like peptidoglycan-associated protein
VKPLYTEEELKQKVIYKKNSRIETLDEVEFNFGKYDLTARGQQIVDRVAEVIMENSKDIKMVNIDGHTDHLGSDPVNDLLSKQRAETVVKALINQGVSPSLLNAKGFGARRPLYNPNTKPVELWKKNRRVEFNIIPK